MPTRFLMVFLLAAVLPLRAEDWTTTDGTTYKDATLDKVEGDTVTLRDQNGEETVSLTALTPKFQKKALYLAAKANGTVIPLYFPLASADKAKALARQLHFPIAWLCTARVDITFANPVLGCPADLVQMAFPRLHGRAIVIFVDAGEFHQVPPSILGQYFQFDDGPIPGGHHFYPPKIVFATPGDVPLGRVWSKLMQEKREVALDAALDAIDNNPAAQAGLAGQPPAKTPAASDSGPASSSPSSSTPAPASSSDSTSKTLFDEP